MIKLNSMLVDFQTVKYLAEVENHEGIRILRIDFKDSSVINIFGLSKQGVERIMNAWLNYKKRGSKLYKIDEKAMYIVYIK